MNTIELNKEIGLGKYLASKKVKSIDYKENIPITFDCLQICFCDDSYLEIYPISRIIKDGKIILCSADYCFNKKFIEDGKLDKIEEKLIYESLKAANECLCGKEIKEVTINKFGDLVLTFDEGLKVEAFFDVSEKDMDFYSYDGVNGDYFFMESGDNGLEVFEGNIYE